MKKIFHFKSIFALLAVVSAAFVSCTETSQTDSPKMSADEIKQLSTQDTIRITLNSDDRMKFDLSEMVVHEGQTVVLTLHNTGTMSVEAMGHNFVLLEKGTDLAVFAQLAMKAKDHEYIPSNSKNVIAHTALIGGGETTEVTFKAPEAGVYDFLCSFPGHYSIMKGKFYVK